MVKTRKKIVKSKKISNKLSSNLLSVVDNSLSNNLSFFSNASTINNESEITRLSAIELSDYNYLSDIYLLNNYNGTCVKDNYKLAFKYDDELRYFLISDDNYYFPSLNKIYPKRVSDYFLHTFKEITYNNLSNLFNQQNLFILQLDDISLIDKIGKVSIPLKLNNANTLRVYEDYEELKYDISDPRFYQYVHMTVLEDTPLNIQAYDGTSNTLSGIEVKDYEYPMTVDEMFIDLKTTYNYNFAPLYTENTKLTYDNDYYTIDVAKELISNNINDLFKIYINYKYNNGKITLYFNYYNYLNSPFIKILDDGLVYLDIIDNTYLKLEPNEDGILHIMFQFKCYSGNTIIGYKNIIIASYHIYNISDDKPKFLIKREHEIEYNQYSNIETAKLIEIVPHNYTITNTLTKPIDPIKFNINISIIHSYQNNITFTFEVDYPEKIIKYIGQQHYNEYTIKNINGILYITVIKPNITTISLPFETLFTADKLQQFNNTTYSIDIIQANEILDDNAESNITFKLGRGFISITNVYTDILTITSTNDDNNTTKLSVLEDESSTSSHHIIFKINK